MVFQRGTMCPLATGAPKKLGLDRVKHLPCTHHLPSSVPKFRFLAKLPSAGLSLKSHSPTQLNV